MNDLTALDIKNYNKQVGKSYYITCPDNGDYYRTVYIRYNPFTQNLQPMVSNALYGSPPPGMDPISPLQLSRLNRVQLQSTFF